MCNRFLTLVGHIPSYIHVQCYSPDPLSDSVAEQTDSDVTIGQYVVSDRNLSLSSHLSLNRESRRGTTDDFATIFLHFSLLSTAL